MASATGELERLAYDLSVRTLGQQERVLEELRSRTGILLAATALVASFLGGRALESNGSAWFSAPGAAAAVVSIVLSVYVLAPKPNLNFGIDGAATYEYFMAAGEPIQEAHRTLAYWIRTAWRANEPTIARLVGCFRAACVALVLSVVLWSLQVGLH